MGLLDIGLGAGVLNGVDLRWDTVCFKPLLDPAGHTVGIAGAAEYVQKGGGKWIHLAFIHGYLLVSVFSVAVFFPYPILSG